MFGSMIKKYLTVLTKIEEALIVVSQDGQQELTFKAIAKRKTL